MEAATSASIIADIADDDDGSEVEEVEGRVRVVRGAKTERVCGKSLKSPARMIEALGSRARTDSTKFYDSPRRRFSLSEWSKNNKQEREKRRDIQQQMQPALSSYPPPH